MRNIFKHISRSYYDIYNALTAAYKNYPVWMFNELAGIFDFLSELMNRIASDILYPKTRESAYGFAARCDYSPTEADGATATIVATLSSSMNKTVSAGYQFGGISSSGDMVIYEVIANTSVAPDDEISLSCKQVMTNTDINIGTISTNDDYPELPIDGYTNIVKSTITIEDSDEQTWTRVDNFDASISTDKHFVILYQFNGKARVQFGDGVTGEKPALNTVMYATFGTTLGLLGQMEIGEINLNIGGDTDIISVTNPAESSGGNNPESVASIIRNARANVRLRDIVWSVEDLETAARASSSSVQKCLGQAGIGTAIIQVIPAGGGNPSAGLKTIVEEYVQSKTQFGVMPVTAANPTYSAQNVTATITVRSGFVSGTVIDLVEFAMTLVTCAFDNQVLEYYVDNGIDATRVDVINTVWAWNFTSDENAALQFIIDSWIDLLGDRPYREWGQDLEVGNLWIMGDNLYDYGVDVFSLTTPATNIVANDTTIINTGTVTVT